MMAELNDLIYHFSNDGLNINVEIRTLVKCKDCKHSKDRIGGRIKCDYHNWWQEPNFFCADGERIDE